MTAAYMCEIRPLFLAIHYRQKDSIKEFIETHVPKLFTMRSIFLVLAAAQLTLSFAAPLIARAFNVVRFRKLNLMTSLGTQVNAVGMNSVAVPPVKR